MLEIFVGIPAVLVGSVISFAPLPGDLLSGLIGLGIGTLLFVLLFGSIHLALVLRIRSLKEQRAMESEI
jgi:hypothetical protein